MSKQTYDDVLFAVFHQIYVQTREKPLDLTEYTPEGDEEFHAYRTAVSEKLLTQHPTRELVMLTNEGLAKHSELFKVSYC